MLLSAELFYLVYFAHKKGEKDETTKHSSQNLLCTPYLTNKITK